MLAERVNAVFSTINFNSISCAIALYFCVRHRRVPVTQTSSPFVCQYIYFAKLPRNEQFDRRKKFAAAAIGTQMILIDENRFA